MPEEVPETPAFVAANQGQVGQAPGTSPGTPAFSASQHPASDGEVEESTHRWIDHGIGRLDEPSSDFIKGY